MNMMLANAIRTLGWPDGQGRIQYGNAAVLCYLSSLKKLNSLDLTNVESGKKFVEGYLNKIA